MLRSLLVFVLVVIGSLMFDTSDANAHRRRIVRRPIARVLLGPPIVRRPWRVYRPNHYGPRVHVGVGIGYGGYYGW